MDSNDLGGWVLDIGQHLLSGQAWQSMSGQYQMFANIEGNAVSLGSQQGMALGNLLGPVSTLFGVATGIGQPLMAYFGNYNSPGFSHALGEGAGGTLGALVLGEGAGIGIGEAVGAFTGPFAPIAVPTLAMAGGFIGKIVGGWLTSANAQIPAGLASPQVGGVLFDQCATLTGDIGELEGAYWDSQRNALVLVGKAGDATVGELAVVPQLDRDHLAVALRAIVAGQAIGVSIDPPAAMRDSRNGKLPLADGIPLIVSYLGRTEGTLFGAIMFEADRLMKSLSLGIDNNTQKRMNTRVSRFRSLIDLTRPDSMTVGSWTRFWFVVDQVKMHYDATSRAVSFTNVRLKVLTEEEKQEGAQSTQDPCCRLRDALARGQEGAPADIFACHLTKYYDDYAQEFPVLARLKELAKITAAAKFFVRGGLEPDLSSLFLAPPVHVNTPVTTPGISATSRNTITTHQGIRTVSLFGGVDMDPEPVILTDGAEAARALRTCAERAKPMPTSLSWDVNTPSGSSIRAVVAPLGPPKPRQHLALDHLYKSSRPEGVLALRRVYDSSAVSAGDFGNGWSLWLPFAVTILPRNIKDVAVLVNRERDAETTAHDGIVFHDRANRTAALYFPDGKRDRIGEQELHRVRSVDRKHGRVSIKYDPTDRVVFRAGHFYVDRDGRQYSFDRLGRLVQIRVGRDIPVRIEWNGRHVNRLVGSDGHSFSIDRDESNPDRINSIHTDDGQVIQYDYDVAGRLLGRRGGNQPAERYAYDRQGRLAEIRGAIGQFGDHGVFDAVGGLFQAGRDEIQLGTGARVMREVDKGRVVSVRDAAGTSAKFSYGPDTSIRAVSVERDGRASARLAYDAEGRLASLTELHGATTRFGYDENGRLASTTNSRGQQVSVQRDVSGKVTRVHRGTETDWTMTYDSAGQPQEWRAGPDRALQFAWEGSLLRSVSGAFGVANMSRRKNTWVVSYKASHGDTASVVLDSDLRLISYRRGRNRLETEYGPRSRAIRSKAGIVRHVYDDSTMKLTVSFEDS